MEMIRNSAKALILKDGRLLLNSHLTSSGEEYFDLPGGGQHVYEAMEEAVIREVLEETGSVWATPEEAEKLPIVPLQLRGRVREVLRSESPVYLGTVRRDEVCMYTEINFAKQDQKS